ncbi:hypothetical protein RHGRI_038724 [Rhododendron griersonianum]|uniref:PB1 domain-containing protein n=1 Tax=Rhododendron griersonianum TaxID=479676 RepID=A0AAV6HMQ8_9ERIC|nr:hypothetical protein RHGRI_038724 [Rhododendron griersonianum]
MMILLLSPLIFMLSLFLMIKDRNDSGGKATEALVSPQYFHVRKISSSNNHVSTWLEVTILAAQLHPSSAGSWSTPDGKGVIISDLLRFVRDKEEFFKKAGKDWKRGYLFCDSPGTDRSSLIAAMANFLEFDIYHLDLTGLTSILELTNVLVSIRNRSLIAIQDFDQWARKLPDFKTEWTLSAIYDPGSHTTDSLALPSLEVLETLLIWEQPNDCVPLLSMGRLTLQGCVQREKSPDLPGVMQIIGVEQRVNKWPRYLGGLTTQFLQFNKLRFRTPDSHSWKSFEVQDSLFLWEQSNSIRHLAQRRTLTHKHCVRLKKSQDLPRSLPKSCSRGLAAQVSPRPYLHVYADLTGRPPDQYEEKNPSPTWKMLSTNGQSVLENQMWTVSNSYPNSNGPEVPHPHIASTQILGENMGSLGDGRNSFGSLEEHLLQKRHISGSMWTVPPCSALSQHTPTIPPTMGSSVDRINSLAFLEDSGSISWTIPSCSEPAPSQLMPTVPRTTGSLDDLRNFLPSMEESFSAGHAFGFINRTFPSCSYPVSSHTMSTVPHTTGSSDDLGNLLALEEEPLWAGHVSESINLPVPSCFDPAPSQSMPTILHTMPTNPRMMSLLTERQDTMSVNLKATYGDTAIKFQFPLTSGINELKEEVSKTLECELGSFRVEYKDEEGEWILMARDENVREYLRLVTSLGNQVTKLKVHDKVPNTANFCGNCECDNCWSLKQKRP